jgi:hypothetical protein
MYIRFLLSRGVLMDSDASRAMHRAPALLVFRWCAPPWLPHLPVQWAWGAPMRDCTCRHDFGVPPTFSFCNTQCVSMWSSHEQHAWPLQFVKQGSSDDEAMMCTCAFSKCMVGDSSFMPRPQRLYHDADAVSLRLHCHSCSVQASTACCWRTSV